MPFAVGQVIGNYRIVRLLGRGGMGVVYEVIHTRLGLPYALKAFSLERGDDAFLRARFLAEGRTLARISHPNLVRVHDLGVDAATGVPYFTMDLVLYKDGQPHTLADVEDGGADEETLAQWYTELCETLRYVHAQGVVHRDVKLNNILLAADRHVVLSDFGTSRFFGPEIRHVLQLESTTQATDGTRLVMGTAHYVAPEVRAGGKATPAVDFYALGIVFYRLLTGMWYEPNDTARGLLADFAFNWQDVLPRLLDEDPARRVVRPLVRVSATGMETVPVRRPRLGRPFWVFILLVTALILVAGMVLLLRTPADAAPDFSDAFAIPESVR